ncbi:hypothetical protein O181_019272 [Austropuccinia psidii MF-1]|uniref:CCHC-type domain-containing protein n=1 Tax=Austropuccinia psidii MF-1 TaxID=1389203 RepID=A0A9Q3C9E1_9BASI|nr:hypothetical protein [Austropuccinia psidii MF-1]
MDKPVVATDISTLSILKKPTNKPRPFNDLSSDLIDTWISYFDDDPYYFTSSEKDNIPLQNLISVSFIRNSIDPTLFDSIRTRIPMTTAVNNIKNQTGSIDEDKLITILYFLSAPQSKEQITTELNTRKATNPGIKIHGEDNLDIIIKLEYDQLSQVDQQISGINAKEKSFPKKGKDAKQGPPKNKTKGPTNKSRTEEWQKQWLTPDNPCFYCLRVGHWAHECKLQARSQDFKNNHKKSNDDANFAAIGSIPLLENSEAMPNSGATHSVVGDVSLFTRLSPTSMILTVESHDKFLVGAIGEIVLNTWNGPP